MPSRKRHLLSRLEKRSTRLLFLSQMFKPMRGDRSTLISLIKILFEPMRGDRSNLIKEIST